MPKLMKKQIDRLTVKFCDGCGPGLHHDGRGLYLVCGAAKDGTGLAKSWVLRFKLGGVPHRMGLGSYADYTLAEARKRRREFRSLRDQGINPIQHRRDARIAVQVEAAKRMSFSEAAEGYIKDNAKAWRSPLSLRQWEQSLRDHVFPAIGSFPVSAIETGHIVKLLRPIWEEKPETAKRVQGRIELILNWSKAQGYRQGDNPAKWDGHLENILPKKDKLTKVEHHKALPVAEMPGFFAQLKATEGTAARAIELLVLSGVRVGEILKATWSEFDLTEEVWTIPAEHTKAHREHLVPLAKSLVAMLKALPSNREPSALVFRIGRTTLRDALARLIPDTPSLHGFRASFKTWGSEHSTAARESVEAALGHAIGDKAERAYDRGSRLAKRRVLMEEWETYCLGAQ